ncbi:hypothetical protein Btru_053798 [Bulinus truncatus]|nr:hypothetical protein Btru_053798 [Bulinus truncatus]
MLYEVEQECSMEAALRNTLPATVSLAIIHDRKKIKGDTMFKGPMKLLSIPNADGEPPLERDIIIHFKTILHAKHGREGGVADIIIGRMRSVSLASDIFSASRLRFTYFMCQVHLPLRTFGPPTVLHPTFKEVAQYLGFFIRRCNREVTLHDAVAKRGPLSYAQQLSKATDLVLSLNEQQSHCLTKLSLPQPMIIFLLGVTFMKDLSAVSHTIILDESTVASKDALKCVNRLYKISCGKVTNLSVEKILSGGDFRQTLFVVVHGTRAIVEASIKLPIFGLNLAIVTLTSNVRSDA